MKRSFAGTSLIGILLLSAHQPAALGQATPNNSFTIDYSGITYKVDTYEPRKTYQDAKNLISPLDFNSSAIWNDGILASNIAQSIAKKGQSITTGNNPYDSIFFPYDESTGNVIVQKTGSSGNVMSASFSQTFGSPRNGWAFVIPPPISNQRCRERH